jgi:hypothetical protein
MKPLISLLQKLALAIALASALTALAQPTEPTTAPPAGTPPGPEPRWEGPPPFAPGGFGAAPGGFRAGGPGPGGMMGQNLELVKKFDKDGNGRLDTEERKAARAHLAEQPARGPGGRGGAFGPGGPGGRPGPFGGGRENQEPPQPGKNLSPADVQSHPDAPTYDPKTLRTFFLEFENADWEQELADFNNTDVEVPAQLTVDGKVYRDVGVHFRGQSSLMMVPAGRKRSLNLSLDWVHSSQNLGGYRTFNLLNGAEDPTFLRAVLYLHIARQYIPAPQANLVRVVINAENWGVYPSLQQFNKDFVNDWFGTTKGARWKVPGSPGARAGLEYLGENPEPYKRLYEIKTKDTPESWARLITLCRLLNQTPPDQLENALAPFLNIDGALKFLALDNALVNNDGYWVRSSDYNLYLDPQGRFHIIPHDVNETFTGAGGPGFGPGVGPGVGPEAGPGPAASPGTAFNPAAGQPPGGGRGFGRGGGPERGGAQGRGLGGPRGGGIELDPLVAANDDTKPLLSKLLAVPALRQRYLGYVRDIAETWLDWDRLGPVVEQYAAVIAADVAADTRKLYPTEAFHAGLAGEPPAASETRGGGPGGGQKIGLKSFADQRRVYLLKYTAPRNPEPANSR